MRLGEEAQTLEGPETHLIAVGSTGFTILFLSFVVLLWACALTIRNRLTPSHTLNLPQLQTMSLQTVGTHITFSHFSGLES